jgi:hypothetical protein
MFEIRILAFTDRSGVRKGYPEGKMRKPMRMLLLVAVASMVCVAQPAATYAAGSARSAPGCELTSNTSAPETDVDIRLFPQAGARPDSGWVIPVTVKFFAPGANVLTDASLYQYDQVTSKAGDMEVCTVAGVPEGIYDVAVVSPHTLLSVRRGASVSRPLASVNIGTLYEGNANDDNVVDIQDFGILAGAFLKMTGQGYDARADFDRNGVVNIVDFGLLAGNFMKSAPVTVAP